MRCISVKPDVMQSCIVENCPTFVKEKITKETGMNGSGRTAYINNMYEITLRNKTGEDLQATSIISCITHASSVGSIPHTMHYISTEYGGTVFSGSSSYVRVGGTTIYNNYKPVPGHRQTYSVEYGCRFVDVSFRVLNDGVLKVADIDGNATGYLTDPNHFRRLAHATSLNILELPHTTITARGQYFIVRFSNGKQVRFENNTSFYEDQ